MHYHILVALVLFFLFIFWAVSFYLVVHAFIFGLRSRTWPTTNGEVFVSKIEKITPKDSGMIISKYRTIIRYKYVVQEVTYTSDTVSFGELAFLIFNRGLRSKRNAEHLATKYSAGSKVIVSYEPENPTRAVLEPGILNYNAILFALILGFMGVFFTFVISSTLLR